jgi:protein-disulfide isomerase
MRYRLGPIWMMALLCGALALSAGCAEKKTATAEEKKKEMESAVRDYIKNHPEEVVAALQSGQEKQRQAQEEAEIKQALANRVEVLIGDSPSQGPADAKITIVEFSDFQCPFCARSMETIDALMDRHKGGVRLVFKNAPLPFHDKAPDAAKAAMAAGFHGKFWEYRAKLLGNQNEWGKAADSKALFVKYAKELGLDTARFEKNLADPVFQKRLDEDKAAAEKLGVGGTPTYFINGVRVTGARDISLFEKVIAEVAKDKPRG